MNVKQQLLDLFYDNEAIPYVIVRGTYNFTDDGYQEFIILTNTRDEFVKAFQLKKVSGWAGIYSKTILKIVWRFIVIEPNDRYWNVEDSNRILKGRLKDEALGVYVTHPFDRFWIVLSDETYHYPLISFETQAYLESMRPRDFTGSYLDKLYCHNWLVSKGFFPLAPIHEGVYFAVPRSI